MRILFIYLWRSPNELVIRHTFSKAFEYIFEYLTDDEFIQGTLKINCK